jgi:hypothetical protein
LDYFNASHQGEYILRDFLTTGDAIRIKLPYLDNGEAPQYLWLENHQTNGNNNGLMDDYYWRIRNTGGTPPNCLDGPSSGIYPYIQIDEDKINNSYGGQKSQYFYQLAADGNYDFGFKDINNTTCIGTYSQQFYRIKNNPFTGLPDLYFQPWDVNNDNVIGIREFQKLGQDNIGLTTREPKNGDATDAFTLYTNNKISTFTNPSSTPLITSMTQGEWDNNSGTPTFPNYSAPNNRTIYLNGLSITITDESNGNIKVNVRFDDRAITGGNLRWAGDKILLKRTANTITPSNGNMLTLSNTTLTVDRSLTNNRYNNPQVVNNRKLFNNTTVFSVEGLSTHQCVFEANTNSTITIDEGSKLEVKQYGTLRLTNSTLYVKNNSILEIQANGLLELNGTAKIVIESGGKLLYNGGTVKLNNNTSIIEIKDGYLEIAANKTFTYSGSSASVYGYLKFASPNAVSDNIIANTGSIIDFTGFSKFKTVFEVTQETMYLPANLAQFKLKNASVLMGPGARVQVNGGSTIVNIDNCRFGSTTGAKTTHRGFVLFGQPNVTVQSSTFENGNYGLYDWLTYNGAAHTFSFCTFHNNNIGLFTHDKGITLNTCSFIKNSQYGWYAEAMSFHSYVNSSTFGGSTTSANGTGLYFQGAYNISLKVDNPSISYNTNGAIIDGTVAYIRCGFVKNNTGNGIEVKNYATLEMGDNWPGYNLPSKVEATNNGITIKCTNAYNIDLINGQNALWASLQGQQKVVNGTLDRGCASFNINVNSNQWKSAGGALSSTDYLLNTVNVDIPCGTYPVTLTDPTPINYVSCSSGGGSGGQSAMMSSSTTLTTSSPSANTTLNVKETQLNEASQYLTSFGGNDDYKSLIKLRKYINDNYTKYSTMDEINMLNRAYYLALESYTNIIQSGANNTQLLFAKNIVDDVQQKMETISSNRKNINKFNLGLNKANIVRTKSNYTDALTELGNNTVNASNSNLTILENWQCIVQTEQVQLSTQTSNTYTPIDASTGCYISTNRMMHSTSLYDDIEGGADEQIQNLFNTQSNAINSYFNFNLTPNPNNGLFTIDIESENETLCEIIVLDVTGKEIYKDVCRVSAGINSKRLDDKLEKGIYFVNIRTELGDNKTMRVIVN